MNATSFHLSRLMCWGSRDAHFILTGVQWNGWTAFANHCTAVALSHVACARLGLIRLGLDSGTVAFSSQNSQPALLWRPPLRPPLCARSTNTGSMTASTQSPSKPSLAASLPRAIRNLNRPRFRLTSRLSALIPAVVLVVLVELMMFCGEEIYFHTSILINIKFKNIIKMLYMKYTSDFIYIIFYYFSKIVRVFTKSAMSQCSQKWTIVVLHNELIHDINLISVVSPCHVVLNSMKHF